MQMTEYFHFYSRQLYAYLQQLTSSYLKSFCSTTYAPNTDLRHPMGHEPQNKPIDNIQINYSNWERLLSLIQRISTPYILVYG